MLGRVHYGTTYRYRQHRSRCFRHALLCFIFGGRMMWCGVVWCALLTDSTHSWRLTACWAGWWRSQLVLRWWQRKDLSSSVLSRGYWSSSAASSCSGSRCDIGRLFFLCKNALGTWCSVQGRSPVVVIDCVAVESHQRAISVCTAPLVCLYPDQCVPRLYASLSHALYPTAPSLAAEGTLS